MTMEPSRKLVIKGRAKVKNGNVQLRRIQSERDSLEYQKKRSLYELYSVNKIAVNSSSSQSHSDDDDYGGEEEEEQEENCADKDNRDDPAEVVMPDNLYNSKWMHFQKFIHDNTKTNNGNKIGNILNDVKELQCNNILNAFPKNGQIVGKPFVVAGNLKTNNWMWIYISKQNKNYKYNVDVKTIADKYANDYGIASTSTTTTTSSSGDNVKKCHFLFYESYQFPNDNNPLTNLSYLHLCAIIFLYVKLQYQDNYQLSAATKPCIFFESFEMYNCFMSNLENNFPILYNVLTRNVFVTSK
uniref:Uncharacterized protein n=1 Tax=Drosophila-associated filamentous virus TaxID=2743186 RepID=A0A6M9U0A0_9VIRU|nr:putative protein 42 [Drosophila-associated filamentous virus]